MMNKTFSLKGVVIALVFVFIKIMMLPSVTACPDDLVCGNFTDYDKIQDCEYVVDQDLEDEEEQEVLCVLWDQPYGYDGYQPPEYPPLDPDLSLNWNEINTSTFILAFKILLFLLFNYFVYSVLTKPSWMQRWIST